MATKKIDKNVSDSIIRDDLALMLQKELNKANKDGIKVSYFLDEDDSPSEITEWVSTGSTLLDLAISNRPNGGLPVSRIVEISGLEGTSKSLLCAHLIAETQKKGGLSVFFDSEFAVDRTFWKALGVDVKNTNYVPFTTLEELFTNLELCIGAFRKADKDRLLTIFVDSIAQASVEVEVESEHGASGYATQKSIILSKAMRKITGLIAKQRILLVFTNQLRFSMSAGPFSEKWTTPGGKSLPFASSVRLRMSNMGKLKINDNVIGNTIRATVIKNRCGPCHRQVDFEVHYNSGIQDIKSWVDFMKIHGIISGTGHGYTFKRVNGEEIKFTASKFIELVNADPSLKEEIYQAICDKYIMKYKEPNSQIIENVETDDSEKIDMTE